LGRILAKRTSFGIPNEINTVRLSCRGDPGSLDRLFGWFILDGDLPKRAFLQVLEWSSENRSKLMQ
jgi:hypothetical protein